MNYKKFLIILIPIIYFAIVWISIAAPPILYPIQGGTGTSTAPVYGLMLVGNAGGTYTLTATSSLGISGGTYTATYPVTLTGSDFSLAFGTTTANTWGALQQFANASSSLFSFTTGWGTNLFATYASTTALSADSLCLTADCRTTWPTGGGTGTVSTSTSETAGYLSYWTSNSATPALLGKVATTSLTATSPLALSNPISVIGSAASALSLPITKGYFLVGNDAGTAQATSTIFISSTGKVGIGTTTPGSLLSVQGIANFTTATSTFYGNGINLTNGCFAINGTCVGAGGGSGTVTSVAMTTPTGLTVSGSPITTSGTLAVSWDTGYAGVLTASTTNWNTFYDTPSNRITAGNFIDWTGNTLNVTDSWLDSTDIDTIAELNAVLTAEDVASTTWSGASSIVTVGTITSGTWNATDIDISDHTNLSVTATGLSLSADAIALTAGYEIPTSASSTNWSNFYYTHSTRITAGDYIDWSGNTLNVVGTLPVSIGGTGQTSWLSGGVLYSTNGSTLSATSTANLKTSMALNNVENTALSTWAGTANITTLGTIGTGVWQGTAITDTYISSAATWNAKQAGDTDLTAIAALANTKGNLIVGGPSSAWVALGIGADGKVLTASSTATNGVSWETVAGGGGGTVTSVAMSVPTGLAISGSPITTAGTLALTYDTGYAGVLTASTTNWNAFYDTPSNRITDGTGLTWSSNTLNCDTASGSVFGCITSADWTTFNNKQAALTFTYPLINTANTISTAFGTTTANTFSALNIFGNASTTQLSIDSATGRLYIPANTNPTIAAIGDIGINTTAASSSLRFYDGTAERALYSEMDKAFSFASSTLAYMGSYGATGTTTILLINHYRPITVTHIYCKTNTGTAIIQFSDGTNNTDYLVCSSSGVSDDGSIANNTWIMREDFKILIGSQTGNPSNITVTATIREDAD